MEQPFEDVADKDPEHGGDPRRWRNSSAVKYLGLERRFYIIEPDHECVLPASLQDFNIGQKQGRMHAEELWKRRDELHKRGGQRASKLAFEYRDRAGRNERAPRPLMRHPEDIADLRKTSLEIHEDTVKQKASLRKEKPDNFPFCNAGLQQAFRRHRMAPWLQHGPVWEYLPPGNHPQASEIAASLGTQLLLCEES